MAFLLPIAGALGLGATTAGAVGLGTAVLSAGVSAVGSIAQGKAASDSANYAAKLDRIQAQQAQDQASVKAGAIARNSQQTLASARGAALESGLEGGGSIHDLLTDTARAGQLDYLTAVYDGTVQATSLRADAVLNKAKAKSAMTSGIIGAGTSILGGVADIYGMGARRANYGSIAVAGTQ